MCVHESRGDHRRSRSMRRERSLRAKNDGCVYMKGEALSVYRNAGLCTTTTGVR